MIEVDASASASQTKIAKSSTNDDDSMSDWSNNYESASDNNYEQSSRSYEEESNSDSEGYSSSSHGSKHSANEITSLHDLTQASASRTIRQGVLPINSDTSILVHRRVKSSAESELISDDKNYDGSIHRSLYKSRHHSRRRRRDESNNLLIKFICCQTKKLSTQLLLLAFLVWILAQGYYFYFSSIRHFLINSTVGLHTEFFGASYQKRRVHHSPHASHVTMDVNAKRSPQEIATLREQRVKEAKQALGTGAGQVEDLYYRGGKSLIKRKDKVKKKKGSHDSEGNFKKERRQSGCSALEWHSHHFPNCNEVHEIDLRRVVRHHRHRSRHVNHNSTITWGFVGAGLWRDVFSCDPRGETGLDGIDNHFPPAVLKMMKSEHPYDQRNFQRHRYELTENKKRLTYFLRKLC